MSEHAEHCRKKAAECERLAMLVTQDHLRKMYLDLARQWREMAQEAEILDRAARNLNRRQMRHEIEP
jgi:hypothetical protein